MRRGNHVHPLKERRYGALATFERMISDFKPDYIVRNTNSGGRGAAAGGNGGSPTSSLAGDGGTMFNPINIADGGNSGSLDVGDFNLYGGLVLDFIFERDTRWGLGAIRIWQTGAATAKVSVASVSGGNPNMTLAIAIVANKMELTITATMEDGTNDLNLCFTATSYIRKLSP